jgi:predicted dehydrogenase
MEAYGRYALQHPGLFRFVAVAEPDAKRRAEFAQAHNIPNRHSYASWEGLLSEPQLARAAFICTPDQLHVAPGLAALERGYDLLLEKPLAPTLAGCRRLITAAEQYGRQLQVGYVLRYAPFFQAVKRAIDDGRLGEIITLSQRENVSYWHMAHSFVRGSWRRREQSSPMVLSKCSHDLDLLYWFAGAPATRIASFGSLRHFRPQAAPAAVPLRCTDGCPVEAQCIYSAIDIYVRLTPLINVAKMANQQPLSFLAAALQRYPAEVQAAAGLLQPLKQFTDYDGWPVRVVTDDTTREGRLRAITDQENPYGRCVYHCDNDVVDQQHVAIEFQNGVTATLIMHGHSFAEGRTLRIDGTMGTLLGEAYLHKQRLVLHDKRSGRRQRLIDEGLRLAADGHGGGDGGLVRAFAARLRSDEATTTANRASLESHLMAFAADEARLQNKVVTIERQDR